MIFFTSLHRYVFSALYTMEMTLKILGKGFCKHRFAYLRDPWNWMDFVVVILGWAIRNHLSVALLTDGIVLKSSALISRYLTLFPSVANLSGIRTFRVLRALRTISVVEGTFSHSCYPSHTHLKISGFNHKVYCDILHLVYGKTTLK